MTTETARIALEARITDIWNDLPGVIKRAEDEGDHVAANLFRDIQRLLTECKANMACMTPKREERGCRGFAVPVMSKRRTN